MMSLKVFVYFNLHKKCFSIRAMNGPNRGRVIAHAHDVMLKDAVFKVSQAGRERVLKEQKKNVHAGVVGTWILGAAPDGEVVPVTYNPYKFEQFVTFEGHRPVKVASYASLSGKRINAWGVA